MINIKKTFLSARYCFFLLTLLLFSFTVVSCNEQRPSANVNDISQDTIIPHPDINNTVTVAKIGVDTSERFGKYITDADGRTLYMFTGDTQNYSSACYVNCSATWPPLLTSAQPEAVAPVVNEEMLGTIERRDGSLQVTYNGWPLYYYEEDDAEGNLTGQDINSFGGDWYIIAPNGSYIAPSSTGNPKARGSWPKDEG